MIGLQWDVEWAVNTDLEPLPSLPTFGTSEQTVPSTTKPQRHQEQHIYSSMDPAARQLNGLGSGTAQRTQEPPIYSSSSRKPPNYNVPDKTTRAPSSSRPNLTAEMANLEFRATDKRAHAASARGSKPRTHVARGSKPRTHADPDLENIEDGAPKYLFT